MSLLSIAFGWLVPRVFAEDAVDLTAQVCDHGIWLDCTTDLEGFVFTKFLTGGASLFTAFYGILFAMLVYYGIRLAIHARQDGAIGEAITAFVQAAIGAAFVSGAFIIANSFGTPGDIADTATVEISILGQAILFLVNSVGFILVLSITIQGIRYIVAINEGNVDAARKNLIISLVGGGVVMLAGPIYGAIMPGSFQSSITQELVGVGNFLATIFGTLCVLGFILAGIMLVISVDEGLKDRARKLMFICVIALLVVAMALAIATLLI